MQENRDYDYFFEVDGERKYDFDLDFRTVDLFNYQMPVQVSAEAEHYVYAREQVSRGRNESDLLNAMPKVAH